MARAGISLAILKKLMGHADKSWVLPDADERPLVWRKAAVVAPVVLARGRIVATWAHRVKARRLVVTVTPLSGWRHGRHRDHRMSSVQVTDDSRSGRNNDDDDDYILLVNPGGSDVDAAR